MGEKEERGFTWGSYRVRHESLRRPVCKREADVRVQVLLLAGRAGKTGIRWNSWNYRGLEHASVDLVDWVGGRRRLVYNQKA